MKKSIVLIALLLALLLSLSAQAQTNTVAGLTVSQFKTFLTIGNVENTAISTWGGSGNIITLGTIATGVWNGTAVTVPYGGTGTATLASNGVLYGNGAGAVQAVAVNSTGTNKFLTQSSSAAPAWGALVSGDIPNNAANTTGSAATLTTTRAIYGNNFDGSAALTQIIASTYGGTGNGFAKFSGPATSEKTYTLPNTSTTILTTNAAVTVPQGGTGLTTCTTGDIIVGSGSNTVATLGIGTNGYVLTSNGTTAAWAAGAGGTTTSVITADQSAAINNIYINNNSSAQCVVTLPSTAAVGSIVGVVGLDSHGFKVAQNASQKIHAGGTTTTTGTGGYITSNEQWDVVYLTCVVANLEWVVSYSSGSLTAN